MALTQVPTGMIADSAVTSAKAETLMQPLGVGQTWQDVTASRAVGTTYTNSTGRPIFLYAVSSSSAWGITVNGTALINGGVYSYQVVVALVIPAGATYALSTGTLGKWIELR
jgi:copper(I)-binding protein